jgi:hypothetical protein
MCSRSTDTLSAARSDAATLRVDLRAENAYYGVPFRRISCAERSALEPKAPFCLKEAHLVL